MTTATLDFRKTARPVIPEWDMLSTTSSEIDRPERVADPGMVYETQKAYDIEVEYSQPSFPVEGDAVRVFVMDPVQNPIRLGYRDDEGHLEVVDWGLRVPLKEYRRLPQEIGRRFLGLYSGAISQSLDTDDLSALEKVSEQMDYRRFAASRILPRRLEATLVRKEPHMLIQFIDESNVKLNPALAQRLDVLQPGDRFSAWFKLDSENRVQDIQHITLLPAESLAADHADG